MTRHLTLAACFLLAASPRGWADDTRSAREAARKDLDGLQGTWALVAMEVEGEPVAAEGLKGRTARYQGDALTLFSDGQVRRRCVVTLDPSQKPKAVNSWDADGPYQDETVPGIYDLDGDRVKFCFARPGLRRPSEFTTAKGTGFLYVVYERKK